MQTTNTDAIEKRIVEKVIDDVLAQKLTISVYDGEETVLAKSADRAAILDAMFSTEEDVLTFHKDGKAVGRLWLVYGNGYDVMSDWSEDADSYLQGALDLANTLTQAFN